MSYLVILAIIVLTAAIFVQGWKLIGLHGEPIFLSIVEVIVEWFIFFGLLVGNVAAWILLVLA